MEIDISKNIKNFLIKILTDAFTIPFGKNKKLKKSNISDKRMFKGNR